MIALTRLNGSLLYVNADLIKWVEAAPDTMLTLVSGEKVVVREPCPVVVERIFIERARLLEAVARVLPVTEALLRASAAFTVANPQDRLPSAGLDLDESG